MGDISDHFQGPMFVLILAITTQKVGLVFIAFCHHLPFKIMYDIYISGGNSEGMEGGERRTYCD
jgi:hypothetical protein